MGKNLEKDCFPDGTEIGQWFKENPSIDLSRLGKQYVITDYGIKPDGSIQTLQIQSLIEEVEKQGGGVIVVPKGTFYTGTLFFKQGVHLYIAKDGVLKGSDNINDYALCNTRIEGESCLYYEALINADSVDGFHMLGDGTIDGAGERAWKAFWNRLKWNPKATNKDEQRSRLVYISNSKNVTIKGLHLKDSPFWTVHLYKCNQVRIWNCKITAPRHLAPSSDAIDVDVCSNVHVKDCYIEVNDDALVLKGGKGPWADTDPSNGSNKNILMEDCCLGYAHACLTCGSESIHNRNVLVRNIKIKDSLNMLWLKMRPDTPQKYEYIALENINGNIQTLININPWVQFFDLKDRKTIPMSYVENIAIRNCNVKCDVFFDITKCPEQYQLSKFTFEDLTVITNRKKDDNCGDAIANVSFRNVSVNGI